MVRVWNSAVRGKAGNQGRKGVMGAAGSNPGGPVDPFFAQVYLMVSNTGTNGQTTQVKLAGTAASAASNWTAPSAITTAVAGPFANSCLSIGAFGRVYWSGLGANFGDFTFEYWMRPPTAAITGKALFGTNPGLFHNNSLLSDTGGWIAPTAFVESALLQWNFYTVQRSGSALKAFVNGVEVLSLTPGIMSIVFTNLELGTVGGGNAYTGHVGPFRLTMAARYTSGNFTPPTAMFPLR